MNVSAPFIVRPIATTLLVIGLTLMGLVAYVLLPVAGLQSRFRREYFQPDQLRIVRAGRRRARCNPGGEKTIFERIDGKPLSAPVRDRGCRLQEHQAAGWLDLGDPPAAGLPRPAVRGLARPVLREQ